MLIYIQKLRQKIFLLRWEGIVLWGALREMREIPKGPLSELWRLTIQLIYLLCTTLCIPRSERHNGSPPQIDEQGIWALPVRGGGSQPLPVWFGALFREEFSKFKWTFAWFWGGANPCQDGCTAVEFSQESVRIPTVLRKNVKKMRGPVEQTLK